MKILRLLILLIAVLVFASIRLTEVYNSPRNGNIKTKIPAKHVVQKDDVLKQKIFYEAGANYLDKVYYKGKIVRWNKAEFPIKVYIEDSSTMPNYYYRAFTEAAKIWEEETGGIVKIEFVDSEKNANIVFKTKQRSENIREVARDEVNTLAYTNPYFSDNNEELEYAIITFYERDVNGKMVKPYETINIAVHEFGHALGLWGHSNDPNSIMYALFNPKLEKHGSYLNRQDKSTLKLLYMITPDYTNGDSTKEKDTIASEILVGTEEERLDVSIDHEKKEALYKKGDSSIRINIASLYEQKGDYDSMLKYIKEAEPLAKTNDELYMVQLSYALYYYRKHDKNNSKKHAMAALNLKDTPEVREFLKYL